MPPHHLAPHCLGIPILDPLCGVAGGASGALAGAIFSGILDAVVRGAIWLLATVGHVLSVTTSPGLDATWFTVRYSAMSSVAALVGVVALCGAAVDAVLRRDANRLGRVILINLPVAGLATMVAVPFAAELLAGIDQLSSSYASATGSSPGLFLSAVEHHYVDVVTATGNLAIPGLLECRLGLVALLAGLALWVELLLRSAAIAITVLFLPMAFAAQIWPSASGLARRLAETMVALILSKFIVVVVLCLGVGAVSGSSGVTGLLLGVTLLVLASFSPFVLLRLAPFGEAALVAGLEGHRQRLTRTAVTGATMAARGAGAVSGLGAAAAMDHLVDERPDVDPVADAGLVGVTPESWMEDDAPMRPDTSAAATGRHVFTRDALGPRLTFIPNPPADGE